MFGRHIAEMYISPPSLPTNHHIRLSAIVFSALKKERLRPIIIFILIIITYSHTSIIHFLSLFIHCPLLIHCPFIHQSSGPFPYIMKCRNIDCASTPSSYISSSWHSLFLIISILFSHSLYDNKIFDHMSNLSYLTIQ